MGRARRLGYSSHEIEHNRLTSSLDDSERASRRLAARTGAGPGLSPAAAGATASLVSSGDPGKLAGCMLSGLGRCIVDALGKGGQRTGQGMMEAVSKEALSGRSVRFARDRRRAKTVTADCAVVLLQASILIARELYFLQRGLGRPSGARPPRARGPLRRLEAGSLVRRHRNREGARTGRGLRVGGGIPVQGAVGDQSRQPRWPTPARQCRSSSTRTCPSMSTTLARCACCTRSKTVDSAGQRYPGGDRLHFFFQHNSLEQ